MFFHWGTGVVAVHHLDETVAALERLARGLPSMFNGWKDLPEEVRDKFSLTFPLLVLLRSQDAVELSKKTELFVETVVRVRKALVSIATTLEMYPLISAEIDVFPPSIRRVANFLTGGSGSL